MAIKVYESRSPQDPDDVLVAAELVDPAGVPTLVTLGEAGARGVVRLGRAGQSQRPQPRRPKRGASDG